jgi:hypothetical protein
MTPFLLQDPAMIAHGLDHVAGVDAAFLGPKKLA